MFMILFAGTGIALLGYASWRIVGGFRAEQARKHRSYIAGGLLMAIGLDFIGLAKAFNGHWWLLAYTSIFLSMLVIALSHHREVAWGQNESWFVFVYSILAILHLGNWYPPTLLAITFLVWLSTKLNHQDAADRVMAEFGEK